jgi:hypothetical protein
MVEERARSGERRSPRATTCTVPSRCVPPLIATGRRKAALDIAHASVDSVNATLPRPLRSAAAAAFTTVVASNSYSPATRARQVLQRQLEPQASFPWPLALIGR